MNFKFIINATYIQWKPNGVFLSPTIAWIMNENLIVLAAKNIFTKGV